MNNLKIKKFNESILDNAKLITRGSGFYSTYDLNNGNIIKVVKQVNEVLSQRNAMILGMAYNEFIESIYKKLIRSVEITTPSIVLPNCVYFEKNIPIAYTIPKQTNCVNLETYLEKNNDLDMIANTIINVSKEVKTANKEGINFPDLGNASNILINTKNKDIRFIDYDGLQIDNYSSFSISSLISNQVIPLTLDKRLYDLKNTLVTNNMDKLSLYALFIYYTTKTYLTDFGPECYDYKEKKLVLKESSLKDYINSIGLNDTLLEEEIFKLFYSDKINYPETSIKKLLKTHDLDKNKFIKK